MSKFLHSIRVWLYKNLLTDDPNDYVGKTKTEHVYDVADISHLCETRGSSGVSATEMTRIVNLWLKEMSYQLCDANGVNTGYFTAELHIKGVFNSLNEPYTADKHKLLFEFHQGSLLRKELEEVSVAIEGAADTTPLLDQLIDCTGGDINQRITIGGIIEIKGYNLKFLPAEAANGIFLIAADGAETKLTVTPTNTPQRLLAQAPANLPAGEYFVEVRTTWTSSGKPLKTIKTGRFASALPAEPAS
jgi:hypothetical protein